MSDDQTITMAAAAELIRQARADERKKVVNDAASVDAVAKRAAEVATPLVYADLRAKIEALPARGVVYPYDLDSLVPETLLYRTDVLALLDGGSDE
jgi:hypothetical protein